MNYPEESTPTQELGLPEPGYLPQHEDAVSLQRLIGLAEAIRAHREATNGSAVPRRPRDHALYRVLDGVAEDLPTGHLEMNGSEPAGEESRARQLRWALARAEEQVARRSAELEAAQRIEEGTDLLDIRRHALIQRLRAELERAHASADRARAAIDLHRAELGREREVTWFQPRGH